MQRPVCATRLPPGYSRNLRGVLSLCKTQDDFLKTVCIYLLPAAVERWGVRKWMLQADGRRPLGSKDNGV